VAELFNLELLDDAEPFEIDTQSAHLFKHSRETTGPLVDGCRGRRHGPDGAVGAGPRRRSHAVSSDWLLPSLKATFRPVQERPMSHPMTPDEEYEFYARPENQQPQGPARRRLTATVPVRFPADLLEQVRAAAAAEDRSVSSWIRRAVEHELRPPA